MQTSNLNQFKIAAIKQLFVASAMLFVQIIVFFVAAGQIFGPRPWLYFCTAFVHYAVSIVVQYRLSPQLLVQRLKRNRKGSKLWDEILMRFSNLMMIIAIPAASGLDGRFQWSNLEAYFALVGLVVLSGSTVLLNWAMILNPYFEPTVRIQEERDHNVITNGPYKIVRHPGYLAGILFAISIPLMIGSIVAFVSVGIYVLLTIIRTWLEDRTLQEELKGYSEYASEVRYRLFPGIW
ncbi:MAG: isoprenylcysteine carboxylmethyltransferase family protein [Candidatus Bathyarchaeota archaeon]|nr:MAG: isoprenylcysteine carboxylmethyltransferase family protein [Candidatus Bathyarchaeota archaeon]